MRAKTGPAADLRKFKRIVAALYLVGGTGHALDFVGMGPFAAGGEPDLSAFGNLTATQQIATALWATLGPAASIALVADVAAGDALLVLVATLDAAAGVSGKLGGAGVPAAAAQAACLAAYAFFAVQARRAAAAGNDE